MTETKTTRTVRRGRLFPEIQWSEEKKAQHRAEVEAIYQRCQVVFNRLQPELIKTHYNWYIAVEPDSVEYFLDKDNIGAGNMCRQKYPNAIPFVFRINETGVCGTI